MEYYLGREFGLAGVSGGCADMHELLQRRRAHPPDSAAADAVELFCYQARKWIGAYAAALGGFQTLVFAGGIGENSPVIRAEICAGLEFLGLRLDPAANDANRPIISASESGIRVRIIATDEQIMIARYVQDIVEGMQ
jgi:acetate kinase